MACTDVVEVFVIQTPSLRGQAGALGSWQRVLVSVLATALFMRSFLTHSSCEGAFAGNTLEISSVESPIVLKARSCRAKSESEQSDLNSRKLTDVMRHCLSLAPTMPCSTSAA